MAQGLIETVSLHFNVNIMGSHRRSENKCDPLNFLKDSSGCCVQNGLEWGHGVG